MTIGACLGVIITVFHFQLHSADLIGLTSTCQNEAITEGQTGHMTYSINPKIPIHDDPRVVIFIKQYLAMGEIVRCRRPKNVPAVTCEVLDYRFKSEGLMGHKISIRIPNVSLSLQGHYELHVAANGIFHPTTSCQLSVYNNTVVKTEKGDNFNVLPIVVPLIICLLVLVLICKRRQIRRCFVRGSAEQLNLTTNVERDTKSLQRLDYSGEGVSKSSPSACDAPNMPENLISLHDKGVTDAKESKDDTDVKIDEEVPSSSADIVNSEIDVSPGPIAIIGNMLSSSASAAYSATLGKLTNSNTSKESGVNPTEPVASSVDPDTHQIGNANENSGALPLETEGPHLNSQLSILQESDKREDEGPEEPTETNGLLQKDQEPSATKPSKEQTERKSFFGWNSKKKKSLKKESRAADSDAQPRVTDVPLGRGQQPSESDPDKGPEEKEKDIEVAHECQEGILADEPVIDHSETNTSKEIDATSTALPVQDTGQSAASGSPVADYHVSVVPNRVATTCDVNSTTAGFNELAKTQRKSEKREQKRVVSPGAGTSQSGQKGMCASSPVKSSRKTTPYPANSCSYNPPQQPQETKDALHKNHHKKLETTF